MEKDRTRYDMIGFPFGIQHRYIFLFLENMVALKRAVGIFRQRLPTNDEVGVLL